MVLAFSQHMYMIMHQEIFSFKHKYEQTDKQHDNYTYPFWVETVRTLYTLCWGEKWRDTNTLHSFHFEVLRRCVEHKSFLKYGTAHIKNIHIKYSIK